MAALKIGIVGGGITGLAAAHALSNAGHEATLYEKMSKPGMGAHGIEVDSVGDSNIFGDVPSRMFNPFGWPQITKLYDELGVKYEAVEATQSFLRPEPKGAAPYLKLEKANIPWIGLLDSFQRPLLLEAKRLLKVGRESLKQGVPEHITFSQFLEAHGFEADFREDFLYPTLTSTVCTCSPEALDAYPAIIVLESMEGITRDDEKGLLRTSKGTSDVVDRLLLEVEKVELDVQVTEVFEEGGVVNLTTSDGAVETYDRVMVATQANHVPALVKGLQDEELELLGSFSYENVEVVVHTDEELMPPQRHDWSTFNMIQNPQNRRQSMCSVWMNAFHKEWGQTKDIFQTILPWCSPRSEHELKRVQLQRPVITPLSFDPWLKLKGWHEDSNRAVQFCGSYASQGLPLLETGLASSRRVVQTWLRA